MALDGMKWRKQEWQNIRKEGLEDDGDCCAA